MPAIFRSTFFHPKQRNNVNKYINNVVYICEVLDITESQNYCIGIFKAKFCIGWRVI